jgi:hypothetical protein
VEVNDMSEAKATIDHDTIRRWVEERGGKPAHVKRTGQKGDPGILRIDFPGFSGEGTLEAISWDEWFEAFEENELAFLHQDAKADGEPSTFNKLVSRDSVELDEPDEGEKKGSAKRPRKGSAAHR